MKTYYWDFYGPMGEGTARHFIVHLNEFLLKNHYTDVPMGVENPDKNHFAAWCRPPEAAFAIIEKALRPKRTNP